MPSDRWIIALIAAISLVAAACAQAARPVTEPPPSTSIAPVSTTVPTTTSTVPEDGVLIARCGAAEFVFGTTAPAGTPLDEEAQRAFDEAGEAVAVEWFGEGKGFGGGWEWVVIERDGERMLFLGKGPDGYADVTIERQGDTWRAAGWGGCRFMTSTTLAGFGIGAWVTDPDSKPDPLSSTLDVLVMERACANGEPPVGREIRPVVLPGEETIEIIVLIEAVEGGATCPSNPWHATAVDIGEPIGERTLFDRHVSPGLIRPWPPTETSMGTLGDEE